MQVFSFADLDSTSTHAARLLTSGEQEAPFAVLAERQTAGRGRRGTVWESVVGNLHLTIALPAPTANGGAALTCIPLKAGLVVQRWIERHYGVRCQIKWPNDLLYAGDKVGGLLLETIAAPKGSALLIGIGLNLNAAPNLDGAGQNAAATSNAAAYQTTCLATLIGRSIDADDTGRALAADFTKVWDEVALTEVPTLFDAFSTGVGQLWQSPDGELAFAEPLGADGSLTLTPIAAGAPVVTLNSVQHGWRWLYQAAPDTPLLIADVGNSAIKLGYFAGAHDRSPQQATAIQHRAAGGGAQAGFDLQLAAALAALAAKVPTHPWPLHMVSVHRQAAAALGVAAAAAGLTVVPVNHPKAKRTVHWHLHKGRPGYALAELGADRLAAIEAWLAHFARRRPGELGLIVAAGTATTIDAVTGLGEHLGGLILPGLDTALASLHQATSQLPHVAPPRLGDAGVDDCLGHDTAGAMTRAVLEMTVGAIERVAATLTGGRQGPGITEAPLPIYQQHWTLAPDGIVVTGGHGPLLAELVGGRWSPDLVLSGARVQVLGGWRQHES